MNQNESLCAVTNVISFSCDMKYVSDKGKLQRSVD